MNIKPPRYVYEPLGCTYYMHVFHSQKIENKTRVLQGYLLPYLSFTKCGMYFFSSYHCETIDVDLWGVLPTLFKVAGYRLPYVDRTLKC